jgi:hypothetical protein
MLEEVEAEEQEDHDKYHREGLEDDTRGVMIEHYGEDSISNEDDTKGHAHLTKGGKCVMAK